MLNKRTIYGVILIIICIVELSGLVYSSMGRDLIVACIDGDIVDIIICFIFSFPLLLLSTVIVLQLRCGKNLSCFKIIMFFSILSQLYVLQTFLAFLLDFPSSIFIHDKYHSIERYLTLRNFLDICVVVMFFVFIKKFKRENKCYVETRITWQSIARKRMPILICIAMLVGVVTVPFIKYGYYTEKSNYYRIDEKGCFSSNHQISYTICSDDVLQKVDSYYYSFFQDFWTGWVFKAKKEGDTRITIQSKYRWGDIEKKTYTIHVDRDKRIEVTGVREIRIEKKY